MATLEATIRRLTGAAVADASAQEIADSLSRHRVRNENVPIVWERVLNASGALTYKRGRFSVWGLVEPDTQAAASAVVTQSDGSAVTGNYTLTEDGVIVFATDQTSAASDVILSAYGYDVNAAAAEIVDQMLGALARDYDVKLGDQSFSRSQARDGLLALARRLRASALPTTALLVRVDDEPSPVRRRRAAYVR